MSLGQIPRDCLTRRAYSVLGVSKRELRRATIEQDGRRVVDTAHLAEVTGRDELELIIAAQRAQLEVVSPQSEANLQKAKEILGQYKLISSGKISWKKGIKNKDPKIRRQTRWVMRTLIEEVARRAGISVWSIITDHTVGDKRRGIEPIVLPIIDCNLNGLYKYFNRDPDKQGRNTFDHMLKSVGLPAFAQLPIFKQIEVMKEGKYIQWGRVPNETRKYVLEALARQLEISVWNLRSHHFTGNKKRSVKPIVLEVLGKSLKGLYCLYEKEARSLKQNQLRLMFARVGIGKLADLSLEEHLAKLAQGTNLQWEAVPLLVQRYLVESLAVQADVCVQGLDTYHFSGKNGMVVLEEIGVSLGGLLRFYERMPSRGTSNLIDFMLSTLGFTPFADLLPDDRFQAALSRRRLPQDLDLSTLSLDQQLRLLGEIKKIPWERVPYSTIRYLVKEFAKQAGVSVWDLNYTILRTDPANEGEVHQMDVLGCSLLGLYQFFLDMPTRKGQDVVSFMLVELGFGLPPFNSIGRLFVVGKMTRVLHSLHLVLRKIREMVTIWRGLNPTRPITSLRRYELQEIMAEAEDSEGYSQLFNGIFGLSFIDLICLAFQHLTLAELGVEQALAGSLRPSMFDTYSWSTADTKRPQFLIGSYNTQTRESELSLLINVLAQNIEIEDEQLSGKWRERQWQVVSGLMARINQDQELSLPLAFALGLVSGVESGQPALLEPASVQQMRLNPAQAVAARLILNEANPLAVVHGPAGSGKTYLLEKVVERLVRDGKRVLYVCPTHKATDVFLDRIDRYGSFRDLPVLRLGISDDKFSVAASSYWVREPAARETFKRNRAGSKGCLFVGTIAAGVNFLVDQGAKGMRQSLFSEWVGGGMRIERDIDDYDVVIVDEASMATKPETYAALALAKRAVLIGDHVQLEPFPLDRGVALSLGFNDRETEIVERSLLEELMLADFPHVLLDRNYRATNPVMIILASRIFYDERIRINQESRYFKLAREDRQRAYPADSLKIVDTSNLPYSQKREGFIGTSFCNHQEAALVVREVEHLLHQGFQIDDIAIITPYQAQVDLIIRALQEARPDIPSSYFKRWVSTFDGFQGDENKCVIISFVRSNPEEPPETGFVGNYHRVNVGITRAKERMCLIGDWSTLKKTGNGSPQEAALLADSLSLQTRHIFEELEAQVLELEREGRAAIEKLEP